MGTALWWLWREMEDVPESKQGPKQTVLTTEGKSIPQTLCTFPMNWMKWSFWRHSGKGGQC